LAILKVQKFQKSFLSIIYSIILKNFQAIHREMSISELQQTFGVSKHEHVPDYHLLDFFKRIENKNNNSRHLHFKAFNSSYLIQLIPNKLISPHMVSK